MELKCRKENEGTNVRNEQKNTGAVLEHEALMCKRIGTRKKLRMGILELVKVKRWMQAAE